MTLDEAIRHLEDIAEVNEKQAEADESPKFAFYSRAYRLRQYADEHRQLAEWLKDYQRLQKAIENIKTEISEEKENQMKIALGCADSNERHAHLQKESAYNVALDIIDKYTGGKE